MRLSLRMPIIAAIICLSFPALSWAEAFTVKYVDDGDTMICENRDITIRVRLAAINAPEVSRDKKAEGQPFSRESKQVLEKLILGKVVDIKGYGLDDYNRLLAVVNYNGKNINLEMIRQGMAEFYKRKPPKGLNTSLYENAEEEARRASRGIWSQGDKYISPSEWRRTRGED